MGCNQSNPSPPSKRKRGKQSATVQGNELPLRPVRKWTPPGPNATLSTQTQQAYLIPPPQLNQHDIEIHGAQPQLNRDQLNAALSGVAHYLAHHGANITIVTVGGAVNAILLRSRNSTEDVDFFTARLSNAEMNLLNNAIAHVCNSMPPGAIGREWLNNRIINLLNAPGLRERLFQMAVEQNQIVFQQPGLTVLAAPWKFMFAAKIDRMTTSTWRKYDATDAAHFLHQYIRAHDGRRVTLELMDQWAKEFGRPKPSRRVIQEVNTVYRDLHKGRDAVTDMVGKPDLRAPQAAGASSSGTRR